MSFGIRKPKVVEEDQLLAAAWYDEQQPGLGDEFLDEVESVISSLPESALLHSIRFADTARFERYLLEEVIPQVEKKYRIARGRKNRAVVGLSMGGAQSLLIGLSHLDLFSAVAGFSSAVPGDFEDRFKTLLDDPTGANTRIKLLWIGCGKQDSLLQPNQRLSELLRSHKVQHTFQATDGLHNFAVWRRYLVEVAPLLFRKTARP